MRKGWKDITSRSRGEAADSPPRITELSLDTGRLCLLVHRYIGYDPGQWLMTCSGLFDKHPLSPDVLDVAQEHAEELVALRLMRWAKELKAASKKGSEG